MRLVTFPTWFVDHSDISYQQTKFHGSQWEAQSRVEKKFVGLETVKEIPSLNKRMKSEAIPSIKASIEESFFAYIVAGITV